MYIVATGLTCSVGLNAQAACAAMRAGIAGFEELPYVDNRGEQIVGAAVPGLASELWERARLVEILALALEDCLQENTAEPLGQVPILVGLAEPERPGGRADLSGSIVRELERRLDVRFHPTYSQALPHGHTAGFRAIAMARDLMQQRGIQACLVSGVDSYVNARSLHWLDAHWRLKNEENSDGVIPGEAAAAILLSSSQGRRDQRTVEIVGMGFGHEEAVVLSDEPLLGIGLAASSREALADARLEMHEIDFRISDVTGESYGFREQILAVARTMRKVRDDLPIWHSADSIGDTGAAAGICELVTANEAYCKGFAPGSRVMCYTSAVSGDRAVVVMETDAASTAELRQLR